MTSRFRRSTVSRCLVTDMPARQGIAAAPVVRSSSPVRAHSKVATFSSTTSKPFADMAPVGQATEHWPQPIQRELSAVVVSRLSLIASLNVICVLYILCVPVLVSLWRRRDGPEGDGLSSSYSRVASTRRNDSAFRAADQNVDSRSIQDDRRSIPLLLEEATFDKQGTCSRPVEATAPSVTGSGEAGGQAVWACQSGIVIWGLAESAQVFPTRWRRRPGSAC